MIISRTTPKRQKHKIIGCNGSDAKDISISMPTGNRLYINFELFDGNKLELSLNQKEVAKLQSVLQKGVLLKRGQK